eukprot:1420158-Rhodomonas_salina.1
MGCPVLMQRVLLPGSGGGFGGERPASTVPSARFAGTTPAMLLRYCYAVASSDAAYGATPGCDGSGGSGRSVGWRGRGGGGAGCTDTGAATDQVSTAPLAPTPCLVLTRTVLLRRHVASGFIVLVTEGRSRAMVLRACYALCGTEIRREFAPGGRPIDDLVDIKVRLGEEEEDELGEESGTEAAYNPGPSLTKKDLTPCPCPTSLPRSYLPIPALRHV